MFIFQRRANDMAAISNRFPPVSVEYDCRGKRVTKTFSDPYVARRFFIEKDKAGKHPVVRKATT